MVWLWFPMQLLSTVENDKMVMAGNAVLVLCHDLSTRGCVQVQYLWLKAAQRAWIEVEWMSWGNSKPGPACGPLVKLHLFQILHLNFHPDNYISMPTLKILPRFCLCLVWTCVCRLCTCWLNPIVMKLGVIRQHVPCSLATVCVWQGWHAALYRIFIFSEK